MVEWLKTNWFIVWGIVGAAALFTWQFKRQPDDVPVTTRIIRVLVPSLDPEQRKDSGLTLRAVVLWLLAIVILVLARIFVPSFK